MPPLRLPPALQVFPTLQRFPALRPRRQAEVPIGCGTRGATAVDAFAAQQSVLHLYHDLGVLVFAGATPQQTRRIGDIVRQVVAWGGLGGAAARMGGEAGGGRRRREGRLGTEDLFEAVDARRAGLIKPEALLRMATARFRQMLETQISEVQPALRKIHIQETQVLIPGSPPPNGTVLQTASGPRRLPIDSFASICIDRTDGHAIGEARFFTAGTGAYVGAARVDYEILHHDKVDQALKPVWGHGKLGKRRAADGDLAKRGRGEVLDQVLRPLWQLEREVWAERAEEVLKSGMDGVE
ncbi:hypothetical protein TOPH_07933 [Tolypocladium ophioglossoides CBS 100239]|uniref:Uncharacterized protein n=1 Tax=Tolypocladium ophioglossoides (strain CBS 100239) TaxID=1163406 RepID=A0A0L0N098_TOLOC|nr:hypothetical protein TOPH_07933 [Tolypocladium ophioglossoides CBS 100239]